MPQGQASALDRVAALEPDEMRAYLVTHPLSRGGRLWCDRLIKGVDEGRRDCLRLYAEALKWVGAQQQLYMVLVQQLGVRNEEELKELVESGKRLRSLSDNSIVSLERYRDEALDLLSLVIRERPEWRQDILHALSGKELSLAIAQGNGREDPT